MKVNKITLMVMGLALASLFASCKKENENNNNDATGGKGFTAQTEQGNDATRTHLNGTAVQWTANDQILVANQNGSTLVYTLNGGAGSTKGTFASNEETEAFLRPDYAAIYPAESASGVSNSITVTSDGVTAVFDLPATQTYCANSFAEKAMPMAAYSESQNFEFKNVLGGICFPLTGEDGAMVTRIVLTSNANEALWGSCPVTISNTGADPEVGTITNDAASKNVITLDCSANGGVALSSTPVYFYIMVPPGTLEGGFMVQAFDGSVNILEKSTTDNPGSGFISRNCIKKANGNLHVDRVPEGALKGTFTVNADGDKIYFSKGTLRYQPSTGIWRFADVQYDRLHTEAEGYSVDVTNEYQPDYNGWIELFGWGCTGQQDSRSNSNQIYYQPYDTNDEDGSLYGPTGSDLSLSVEHGSDFGAVYVENGEGYGWRMFSFDEVQYMMGYRPTKSGIRFAFVSILDNIAVIILPDEWDSSLYPLQGTDSFDQGALNMVSIDDWNNILEPNGVMLMILPGGREGTVIHMGGDYAHYWTSTPSGDSQAVAPFGDTGNILEPWPRNRAYGGVVRLVRDVPRP